MTTEEIIGNFGEEEWENFHPNDVLPADKSAKIWNGIDKDASLPRVHYPYFRWMAVAASLFLAIGLSWFFILKQQRTGIASGATARTKNISNTTAQKMMLSLSDGSTVELSPNSTLSYPQNFNSLKRVIVLNGEATFTVAKNVARPFCVYSNSISITVLGTRFTVKSYDANNATKVILHEGMVKVKIPDSSSRDNKNEYYLTAGDIFIFKKSNKRSPIAKPGPVETVAAAATIASDSLSARVLHLEKDKDNCYVFENYPLDVVFDQLQIIYNTKIIYNKAELGNRTFIGKIDVKDPLYHILKSISLLNKFGLHKQGDSLIIGNLSSPSF